MGEKCCIEGSSCSTSNFISALPGGVVAAALTYGAAHGFKSRGQFAGSIVAAIAFTIGYAATWTYGGSYCIAPATARQRGDWSSRG